MATTTGEGPSTENFSDQGSAAGSTTGTPPPPPPAAARSGGNSFFTWIRGLGILRSQGWIGGVAAGIAARLGIDAILVRGILVVIAVLGGPVVLVYAAAWLLLPDENDVIHAEELARGRFSPAIAGIGALALLSLLPLTQGFWYAGTLYWGEPAVGASIGRVLWTAILITGLVFFVLWVARRSNGTPATAATAAGPSSESPGTFASAPTPAAGATAFAMPADTSTGAPGVAAPPADFAPEPPKPGTEASAEELVAWRLQQEEWKRQRAAWAAEQKRTDRQLAAQVAGEKARQNAAAAMERARIRRLTRPRVSGAYVGIALGLALVSGALAALLWPGEETGYDSTVGLAAAVFVLGAAIILAGSIRRRSGFLSFVGVVALVSMLISAGAPAGRQLIFPAAYGISTVESGRYAQPFGSLELYVWDNGNDDLAEIDIWQGRGTINILVDPGQTVRVEAVTDGQDVHLLTETANGIGEVPATYRSVEDDRYSSSNVVGASGSPDVVVTIWQGRGEVNITERSE
jgi:phage shock protein PspC (stress-responsive transcriptional regulator)